MPLFDFRCSDPRCGHRLIDELVPLGESDVRYCPKCGAHMNKLLSPHTPIFLGEGWTERGDK